MSPDGNWLLIFTTADSSSPTLELRRVPMQGGSSEPVLKARKGMDNIALCAVAPSNLCVLAERSADKSEIVFTAFDSMKGRGAELLHFQTLRSGNVPWSVSADGTRIAVLMNPKENTVHVIHLDGKPTENVVAKGISLGDVLNWSADGRSLFIDYPTKRGMALGESRSARECASGMGIEVGWCRILDAVGDPL